jgi:hypothetical protein
MLKQKRQDGKVYYQLPKNLIKTSLCELIVSKKLSRDLNLSEE